jgi:GntR family transcriptional regulator
MPRVARNDPPYVQIMDHYRKQILDGELTEGDRLPPVAEIGAEWGVSTATAGRAISQLQVEGVVRTTPQGTFVETLKPVGDSPRDRMARVRRTGMIASAAEQEVVRVAERIRVPVYVAELMGLDPAGDVIRRESVATAGRKPQGEPVALSVAWFAPELAEALPELLNHRPVPGLIARIEAATGKTLVHGEDHLHARDSDTREATALGLPVGAPILAGAYIWTDAEGAVLEYGEFCFPPRRTIRYDYDIEPATAPETGD